MKAFGGLIMAIGVIGASSAWADCGVNSCQYGAGCYSDNAVLCQAGQRMQCKAGSWTVSSGSDDACSATLKLITIIEVNIEGQTQAKPAEAGVDAVPAKRFEDTIATEVAAICNFRETCSFVPLDVRGRSDATFLVTKLRYACRDRATGSVKIFEPKLPNGGDEHAVYNLDCFGT